MTIILPPVPGLVKVITNWAADDRNFSTAIHVLKSVASAWVSGDLNSLLTEMGTILTTDILPRVGTSVSNINNEAMDLSSAMGLKETATGVGAGSGAGTKPLPVSTALRCSFSSPLRYRGGRPGMFWAGLDSTDQMAGSCAKWSNATEAAWVSAMEDFITRLTGFSLPSGSTINPVWVSYFTGHALRVTPLTFQITNPVVVQQRVCSRRKRLGKGIPGE